MRLLHFADLHLGVENYGRLDPATGLHTRLLDFRRCLERIFDHALDADHDGPVDAVLFAGDLYRSPYPNPTWQREFALQLRRLQAAGIPVVLVVGNHDTPAAFGRATSVDVFNALELPATHVVRTPRLLRLETASGPLQVAGLPWPTRHYLRADEAYRDLSPADLQREIGRLCARQIQAFAEELQPEEPAVLVAHVAAAGATLSGCERSALIGSDPTLLTSDLAHPAFDYVALGHVHRHQDLNHLGSPPVVYSGSPERVDFGEQSETKGFCVVSIDAGSAGGRGPGTDEATRRGRRTAYEFVPTPSRRFVTVDVDATDTDDPTDAVVAAVRAADVADAVVRVRYAVGPDRRVDAQAVRRALDAGGAHVVAAIVSRQPVRERLRRSAIPQDADLSVALRRYIDNHQDLEPHRDDLLRCAAVLDRELDDGSPEGGR